jgi:NTP pyrophosphatase (non-canonical NTP hydrolase)
MHVLPEAIGTTPLNNLQQFETWVSQDWVYESGSDEAQVHVRGKLDEESAELAEVLASSNREDILSDLGDFLWTATANGLNVGITSFDALRHELRTDQVGTEAITFDQIDKLALELMPDLPVDQMEGWVKYLGHYLGKAAKQWRSLSPLIDTEAKPQNFSEAWIQLKRLRAYDALTQAVLITSALAQRYANATISDVVVNNVEKLQNRKAAGLPMTSLSSDSH